MQNCKVPQKPLPFRQFTGNPNDPFCSIGTCHVPIQNPSDLMYQFPNSFAAHSSKISPPYEPNPECDLDDGRLQPKPCNDIYYPTNAEKSFCTFPINYNCNQQGQVIQKEMTIR